MAHDPTHQVEVVATVKSRITKMRADLRLPATIKINFAGFVRDGYEVYFINVPTVPKLGTLCILRHHKQKGYKLSYRPHAPFSGTVYCQRDFRFAHGAYKHGVHLYWKL